MSLTLSRTTSDASYLRKGSQESPWSASLSSVHRGAVAGDMPTSRLPASMARKTLTPPLTSHLHGDAVFLIKPKILGDIDRHMHDIGWAGRHAHRYVLGAGAACAQCYAERGDNETVPQLHDVTPWNCLGERRLAGALSGYLCQIDALAATAAKLILFRRSAIQGKRHDPASGTRCVRNIRRCGFDRLRAVFGQAATIWSTACSPAAIATRRRARPATSWTRLFPAGWHGTSRRSK